MTATSSGRKGYDAANWDERAHLSRRHFLSLLLAGGVALGGAAVADGWRFEVNRYRVRLPGLTRPLRAVQLSDLHYGRYVFAGSLRRWVDAALAEAPDLVLITGDFIDTRVLGGVEPLLRELARLSAPLGVWGVWGNHDYRGAASLDGFGRRLEAAGVHILTNRGVRLRSDLFVAGVDDFWRGRPDVVRALKDRPEGAACLLMSHNPDLLPEVPQSVGLTLCGHTHGGQVKIPLYGPVVTSSRYGRRFAEGWIREPVPAFVSRGLGFSLLPLRMNCRAEVVVLELEP